MDFPGLMPLRSFTILAGWLKVIGLSLACLGLVSCTTISDQSPEGDASLTASEPIPNLQPPVYETVPLPAATVHVVTIPDPVTYPVRVAVGDTLQPVDELVPTAAHCGEGTCGIAAINAGFFDPNNGLTTSYGVVAGELVADPRHNSRLVDNPDLATYMDQILNRSEFRRYDCGGLSAYAIVAHAESVPGGCTLVDAVGAGPQLWPLDTSVAEAFVDDSVSPRRDALGSQSANARSAIGIADDGSIMLVMVAQVPGISPSGMNFADLADFMAQRGATQVLNLDGGSSATLAYRGNTIHGRLDSEGVPIRRSVKSVIWVGE
jgi:hypothetical protein